MATHTDLSSGGAPGSPAVRVRVLGAFEVRVDGEVVAGLDSGRVRSLLGYLIAHRDVPARRDQLSYLLWPESTESQARTNLRQLLHTIRHALPAGAPLLAVTSQTVALADGPHVDAIWFEEQAATGREQDEQSLLEAAADIYRGELLPGSYDDWILAERDRLASLMAEVLEALCDARERDGDLAGAILVTERQVRHDPLREEGYRRLVELHARAGDRARAVRAYHLCSAVLDKELGVTPDDQTQAVYQEVLAGTIGPRPTTAEVTERTRATAVQRDAPTQSTGAAVPDEPPAALVGRQEEWLQLVDAWNQARSGTSRLLVVSGEPGIGKSFIVDAFARAAARAGATVARTRSYEAEGRLSYGPVTEWLRSEPIRPAWDGVDPAFATELSRLLPELGQQPSTHAPSHLTDDERRTRLREGAARMILSVPGPVLLVADDMQWCDDETTAFVHYLLRYDESAPLMVACTARSGELAPGGAFSAVISSLAGAGRVVEVALQRLGRQDTVALAEQLAGSSLSPRAADLLFTKTEGNPLFCIEMVRGGFLATGAGPGTSTALPRADALIADRLSKLSDEASDLVGAAAVVGREFDIDVLARAIGRDQDELVGPLDELWRHRVVVEHGTTGYDFTHDRIREVAYAAVGPARRRQLHGRVAAALLELRADDPPSAQIAAHCEAAGMVGEAVDHLHRASSTERQRFAIGDATTRLIHALELLPRMPHTRERDELELRLQIDLGALLVSVDGYSGEHTHATYSRALELTTRLGQPAGPPILRGVALANLTSCHFHRALHVAEELVRLGERDGDTLAQVEGHYVTGVSSFWLGRLQECVRELERALAKYERSQRDEHIRLFAQDPEVVCMVRAALGHFHLGRADTAVRMSDEAVRLAEASGHPFSLSYTLCYAAWIGCESGDDDRLEAATVRLVELSKVHVFLGAGRMFDGWLAARRGDLERAAELIDTSRSGPGNHPESLHDSYAHRLRALVLLDAGRPPDALEEVSRGLRIVEAHDQRYVEAELHRIRALALAASGGEATAVDEALRTGLSVARANQDLALELRLLCSATQLGQAMLGRQATSSYAGELATATAGLPEGRWTADATIAGGLLDAMPAR